ncbi:DUF3558 domain-containing protein [Rhodococcus sp. BP-252]|uniref:DUF3558 domain-containing protein n=1 Tax=Rhodococcoides kyotonense TaxID=398843 RepID=A0A177YF08_9NOCA|nr:MULTISPECIES: DUF3558 domain-containing protein [Rhodococcus]MBY6411510.1 DUF3558 domain-containing protein [Rhodococcus sp. BP-320]MBY6417892.1 DUF3558 domain-containing protein [Rhodococcus sp. BP-321]MBY6422207.1 DUF3558 domain-containing protein [Rhodococcus sp. BP-324]MBY6427690.1 DUF3558 domain-containing protein [Rhodococcus sp. BP-323]MBY6433091.1 DUF3558 domain-containing protein [Rhodococcus sp. BP-322]
MRSRRRALAAAVSAVALLAGCSTTVTGTPTAEGYAGDADADFAKLLQECTAVPDDKIAETVQADGVYQYFFGAVCMWDGSGPAGAVDVTFAWFETNSLGRERTLSQEIGYAVEDVSVAGATAFLSRRPGDAASCGITAAYSGTITWWVQYRSGAGDPCAAATRLAELTLQRNQ